MKKLFFVFISLIAYLIVNSQEVTISGNKFYVDGNEIWFNGVNTPWNLWCDFGHPNFDYDWWDEEFASYEENHITLARVWIHCSGDISPNIDETGYISGVDDIFWDHMDHLFAMSKKHGVYVMPALLSFDITKNTYDNYESWRLWLQSSDNIQSYIDNVLIPMLQRYEDEPYLLGWEICNEPEWMFEVADDHGPQDFYDVQTMHAMMAAAVHENSERFVTTGSAAPKWNSPIYDTWGEYEGNMFSDEALSESIDNDNAYLDFYQYHWYAWQTEWFDSPWTMTTEEYEVDDRPVIVGECEGLDVCDDFICMTLAEEYEAAYQNGFDGVCGWKTDTTVYANIIIATNSFYNDHPDLVYAEGSRPTTVTAVSISETSISIEGNETYQLTATVQPADATVPDVIWESASPTIASVSDEGVVTGITPGTTTITVSSLYGGVTAYCSVEVTSAGSNGNCTNPVSVALPYTYSGEGPVCYVTSGDITVVQSYSTDLVELNGVDITNSWFTDIPSSADGVYWIYYESGAYGYLGIQGTGGETAETVELTTTISGEGSVSPSSGSFTLNSTIQITATPASGYEFSNWSGDASGTDNPVSVTMDADKSITATFTEIEDPEEYTLTIIVDGEGTTDPAEGNYTYTEGTIVELSATADSGYVFSKWTGDITGTSTSASLTMDGDKTVTATFIEYVPVYYDLTVTVDGNGSVSPESGTYLEGTEVDITATADSGYVFSEWSGDIAGTSTTITVTMDGDKSVTALFEEYVPVYYDLTVTVEGNGSVSPESGTYLEGTVVDITAIADSNNYFVSWSGDASSTDEIISVTMDSDKDITATFASDNGGCENPTTVSLTFSYDGDGDYCWFTTDDISYVNSWSTEYVYINNVDYTNSYSDDMPDKIDGGYYFSYEGLYSWSHLEIVALKSTNSLDDIENNFSLYPNPFKESITLQIMNTDIVESVKVIDQLSRIVDVYTGADISAEMEFGTALPGGIYYLIINTTLGNSSYIISKE